MTILSFLGLASGDELKRLDSGEGTIYERTIEIGGDIIAVENIGTIRVIDGRKNPAATLFGIGIAVIGFVLCFSSRGLGILILILGAGLAAWNILRKVEICLSFGTCDGRSTAIVSKNRQFLHNVRDFLRQKIDTKSGKGATINITDSKLEGVFAIGTSASAQDGRPESPKDRDS